MSLFKDIAEAQGEGMRAMASAGVIGLHMVSGPIVGVAIGYCLDLWLDVSPWGKLLMLPVGIGAGYLNVWRDAREYARRLDEKGARRK